MAKPVDLFMVYMFIKRLATPFDETDAYKMGIIDERGKKIKDPEGSKEEAAYGYFDRLVFNIKKLIEKLPGGKTRLASYAAALLLLREQNIQRDIPESELQSILEEEMSDIKSQRGKTLKDLFEDAPANVTGAGVVGTGDDVANFKRMDARKKEMQAFLKRYMKERERRQKIKERKDFMKRFGISK